MDNKISSTRLYGLDTLRALAIILVLIYHYRVVVSNELLFGFITRIGWVGVDLFFVLSGYLIGDQILRAYAKKENFSLKHFYARRLLRTLPNYYVVLALYLLLPALLSPTYTAPLWQFLTFTQNLDMRPMETFTHSWSLCVEEQFYLLFPLMCMLALARGANPVRMWVIIIAGFIAAILIRAYMLNAHGGTQITGKDYYEFIYYPSYSRFDELLPGIAIALLKNYHPSRYEKLLRYGNAFFVAGLAGCGWVFYVFLNLAYTQETGTSTWTPVIGYSLLAISFALLVMAALSPCCWLYRQKISGAASLALWSYAIYLIHKPLYQLLEDPVKNLGINTDGYLGMGIIVLISIISGWLLFRLVETPFMNLRTRWFPSNNKTAQVPAGALKE
ncbi:acyltransferase [Cellvibrio sp. UBA7661]|uniref:acyltransferase family protein n=1 Tax=Cellvibrio sp. UBA7661 TaxID=1946311 RepID=UPI002F34F930